MNFIAIDPSTIKIIMRPDTIEDIKRKLEYILKKHALGWTSTYNNINKTDYTLRIIDKEQCEKELTDLFILWKDLLEIESEDKDFITYLI